jgi:hypothetical protein
MGRSRVTLAGVVALVVASMAGAPSTGDAAAVSAPPDCNPAGVVLSQAPDGRVDACLRVGDLAPGPHMISLQDLLEFGPPPRKFLPPGVKRGVRPTPPSEPAVSLSLSPSSGGPGTIVTVRGRLTPPFHPRDSHPNLCWDGCQNGLDYDDPPVRWTSPTAFRTRIIAPAAPWIEGGPVRVAPLVSGDYRVAIQCVREVRACASVTEGTATFHLRVTRPTAWCRTQSTCARLRVTPAHAVPGQVVRVTGFAPLAAGETPIASFPPYQMVLTRRRPREHEVRFTGRDGVREATVGLGALDVEPAPRYADLRDVTPLAQVSDSVPQISADPANPGTVAWCAGTTIEMSGPGGATPIPSATARTTLQAMGFSFRFEPDVTCAAVAPLASSAGVPAGLAAAFDVTTAAGAPPFYLAVLVTRDNGQTWTPSPVPPGSGPAGFGGFRYAGASLQAVFGVSLKGAPTAYPEFSLTRAVTEVLSADGQSWSPAPLGCPPVGPCVTFGPVAPGNCAMNGTIQTLLRSTSGGRGWTSLDFPSPVQDCGESELVATSPRSELLVDSLGTDPVLRTTDGGATWHDVAIPRSPRGNITVLPDGRLLLAHGLGYSGPWKLLRRGRPAWCDMTTPSAAVQRRTQITPVTVIGDDVWWLTGPPDDPSGAPAVNRLPVSALTC